MHTELNSHMIYIFIHFTAKESLSDAQVESMLESNDTHIFAKDVCSFARISLAMAPISHIYPFAQCILESIDVLCGYQIYY